MTKKITISSFNVNSIKARINNVTSWIKSSNPDIICLQELKCQEENFPFAEIEDLGYNIAINGQKTYNGVAILSKFPIEDIKKSLPTLDNSIDEQARYIEAIIPINNQAIRIASIYLPNGGGEILPHQSLIDTTKFQYKLNFIKRLNNHIKNLLQYNEITFFAGDFNIAVEAIDVYNPETLSETVCFHIEERKLFRKLFNLGITDSFRSLNPKTQSFTWWDYRGNGWQHNKGMRIDYVLCSPQAADKLESAFIEDKGIRDQEKPSDHCPTTVEINI